MNTLLPRITGAFEIALSVLGAALLVIQTLSGADGLAQIGAALVALVAPVCAAIKASGSSNAADIAEAIAKAVTETLGSSNTST